MKKLITINSQGDIMNFCETNDPTFVLNTPHQVVDITGKKAESGEEMFDVVKRDRMKYKVDKKGKGSIIRERKPEELIVLEQRKIPKKQIQTDKKS